MDGRQALVLAASQAFSEVRPQLQAADADKLAEEVADEIGERIADVLSGSVEEMVTEFRDAIRAVLTRRGLYAGSVAA